MAARLVFVHGIGGPRDASVELKAWTEALAQGARAAGHTRFPDKVLPLVDRRFAYYGDLFHRPGSQGSGDGAGDEPLPGQEDVQIEELFGELVDNLFAGAPVAEVRAQLERVRRRLNPEGRKQGPGKTGRDLINAMDALLDFKPLRKAGRWSNSMVLRGELRQVVRYLSREPAGSGGQRLDSSARKRVTAQLDGGATVVVAHSLGSIVTYEALHEAAADVRLLVTIGSPLALRTAVLPRVVPSPLVTPEGLSRWLDFWDREDIVAARPVEEGSVAPNASGVRLVSSRIRADGLWTHTATKYLSHSSVAGKIAETLMDAD